MPLRRGVRLVLFGMPGSGKGTQGDLLAEMYGVPHISTGAIIRDHIARGTEFGRKVEAAIAGGNFAPDEDILYWVCKRLEETDAQRGYILDGFPRDLAQAEVFEAYNKQTGRPIDAAVELLIDEAALIARISGRLVCPVCGTTYHLETQPPRVAGLCDIDGALLVRRPDDEPEKIQHRIDIYRNVTLPLRDFYRSRGVYVGVDAAGTPDQVLQCIREALEGRKSGVLG